MEVTLLLGRDYEKYQKIISGVSPCEEGEYVMPLVQVEMLEGRNEDQKREMVKEVTNALVKTINCNAADIWVIIREMKKENFAVEGTLFVDKS